MRKLTQALLLASAIGSLEDRANLATKASSDPLTGLANHRTLQERLAAEMTQRWRRGERPLVEEFLARQTDLWDQPEVALELIAEELNVREVRLEEDADERSTLRLTLVPGALGPRLRHC
jgi:hypothetical protein